MSGIFPDDWKCARLIPLFKQGESFDLYQYQPISVISVVAKVFERIVYDQLYNFLSSEGIISSGLYTHLLVLFLKPPVTVGRLISIVAT